MQPSRVLSRRTCGGREPGGWNRWALVLSGAPCQGWTPRRQRRAGCGTRTRTARRAAAPPRRTYGDSSGRSAARTRGATGGRRGARSASPYGPQARHRSLSTDRRPGKAAVVREPADAGSSAGHVPVLRPVHPLVRRPVVDPRSAGVEARWDRVVAGGLGAPAAPAGGRLGTIASRFSQGGPTLPRCEAPMAQNVADSARSGIICGWLSEQWCGTSRDQWLRCHRMWQPRYRAR